MSAYVYVYVFEGNKKLVSRFFTITVSYIDG